MSRLTGHESLLHIHDKAVALQCKAAKTPYSCNFITFTVMTSVNRNANRNATVMVTTAHMSRAHCPFPQLAREAYGPATRIVERKRNQMSTDTSSSALPVLHKVV